MKKKFLALMLSFTMVMSMTACGGSDADSSDSSAPASEDEDGDASESELGYVDANGLQIALPAEFEAVETGTEGLVAFANGEQAFITVTGPSSDGITEPDQLTEESFVELFERGGYTDVVITNVARVEQSDGATAVTAFAAGTIDTGEQALKMNIVMQYYFLLDGSGGYAINYSYPEDDTATDDVIADILASVMVE